MFAVFVVLEVVAGAMPFAVFEFGYVVSSEIGLHGGDVVGDSSNHALSGEQVEAFPP